MNLKTIILSIFLLFPFTFLAQESIRKKEILIQAMQSIEIENINNPNNEKLINKLDSLTNINIISDKDFSDMIIAIGGLLRTYGKLIPAVELLLKATALFEEGSLSVNQKAILVKLYIPLGASHEELGMLNRSMDFYLKALSIAEENNFSTNLAMIYNNLGVIHHRREEYEKAEEFYLKALEINKLQNNKEELSLNYNNLAGIYLIYKEYNTALNYALSGIQQLDHDNSPNFYYYMQANIGSLYLSKNNYNLAFTYLQNALINQLKHNFATDIVQTYTLLFRYYNAVDKKDSANFYIEKALQQAQFVGIKHDESILLSEFSKYYNEQKNYPKAYSTLLRSVEIKDSIYQIDNKQKINDFEMLYDAEKKMRENELLLHNITIQKLASDRSRLLMAAFSIVLIIAVSFLVYRSKRENKIRKSNELIAIQNVKLYETEKELQKQKNEELNTIIDKRNRELTTYTINMVKNNEFLSDLNFELKQLLLELNPKFKNHKEHIQKILSKLQHQKSTNNWEEFHYYFEQVHPSFYENLKKKFPDLTLKEERLCAFLKLGLSSKEISSISFREVRSVESSRNRLRKKMGLNPENSLTDFLNEIL